MSVRLFALECGWLTGPLGLFLRGEKGRLKVPVPAWLVEHPKGRLLFDAGLHPGAGSDPEARLGDAASIFEVHQDPEANVAARLRAIDVDPDSIQTLVVSHLHFDHAGGAGALPNAERWLQRAEWEAGRDPEARARNFFLEADCESGQPVRVLDGEHDVFGDGSVVVLPTPGHTPGHQSLRVRLASGEVVLTADACYLRRTLEAMHLPAGGHDDAQMLASLERLRALRDRGARILYGHDPELWAGLPRPPTPIDAPSSDA